MTERDPEILSEEEAAVCGDGRLSFRPRPLATSRRQRSRPMRMGLPRVDMRLRKYAPQLLRPGSPSSSWKRRLRISE